MISRRLHADGEQGRRGDHPPPRHRHGAPPRRRARADREEPLRPRGGRRAHRPAAARPPRHGRAARARATSSRATSRRRSRTTSCSSPRTRSRRRRRRRRSRSGSRSSRTSCARQWGDFVYWDRDDRRAAAVSRDEVGAQVPRRPGLARRAFDVTLADGTTVKARPAFDLLKEYLDENFDLQTTVRGLPRPAGGDPEPRAAARREQGQRAPRGRHGAEPLLQQRPLRPRPLPRRRAHRQHRPPRRQRRQLRRQLPRLALPGDGRSGSSRTRSTSSPT